MSAEERHLRKPKDSQPEGAPADNAAETAAESEPDRKAADDERIAKWREERLKKAEAERQERLDQFNADKEKRIAEARAKREAELAAEAEALREQALKRLPSPESLEDARQVILERRRQQRRALAWNFGRFVVVPTVLAALYLYLIATPVYEARSVFTVQTSSNQETNEFAGVIGTMVLSDSVKDAFMLRDFIQSRNMMRRLMDELDYIDQFRSAQMDPLGRLYTSDFLQLDEYGYYRRLVHATVDIQQGLLRLYVQGLSAEQARQVSVSILTHAEDHLNQLSSKIIDQEISLIQESVAAAEDRLKQAHRNVIDLQVQRNLTDMQMRRGGTELREQITEMYQTIREYDVMRMDIEREITALSAASEPNAARIEELQALKADVESKTEEVRTRLVDEEGGGLLNRRRSNLEFADLEREIARKAWESSLSSLENARVSALERRRYIVVVVPPENPPIATIPNRLKGVVIVFLVLFGLYVLGSLMWASLREHGRV